MFATLLSVQCTIVVPMEGNNNASEESIPRNVKSCIIVLIVCSPSAILKATSIIEAETQWPMFVTKDNLAFFSSDHATRYNNNNNNNNNNNKCCRKVFLY